MAHSPCTTFDAGQRRRLLDQAWRVILAGVEGRTEPDADERAYAAAYPPELDW